ncbi:type 1 fimbrial protein [Salmonella enterica]|nr:type 1 fimbrial protein [Salmonella enterica]EBN3114399.1 type 1 fimbrial protein [Salmonella enterica]ECX4264292.1 type 1 fimbrial protein [Salmonella enterica]
MKIKNCLFLLGAAMAVMSSSAFADTTGTQTFTANVTADTCTIANLNQAFDVGTILKADTDLKNGKKYHQAYFDITGCDASVTKAVMIPTFDQVPNAEIYGYAKNKGTAVVDAVWSQDTPGATNENTAQSNRLMSGKKVTVPLVNGGTQFIVGFSMNASSHDSSRVKVGTLDYPLTLTFDFV